MARGAKKGEVRNPRGRPKGSQNKATREMRELLTPIMEKNAGKVQSYLDAIEDPKDWIMCYCRILEFVAPKMAATAPQTPADEKPKIVTIE